MKRREKGHALIELALSAGVMVACLAGTFQFGYTFYVYNQLVTAVGSGARFAAVRAHSADPESDRAAIRNMVVYGSTRPAPLAAPVVAHLGPEHVDVNFAPGADSLRIAIRGFAVDAVFAKFMFDGRPAVEFPYLGPVQEAQ